MAIPEYLPALRQALEAATGASVELIETHISCVLLARDTAYKIKKPIRLPFVDYSRLDVRRHFCEEEVRLNRRLAPSLYQGVSRITGSVLAPELDGPGALVDWAVKMRRFAPGALFSERLAAGTLGARDIDRLACLLARFHDAATPVSPEADYGSPARRRDSAIAAADGLAARGFAARAQELRHWLQARSIVLEPSWSARRAAGRVRECHGDLHLSNVLMLDGEIAAFDGIEFDPALRWIDVIDDIAFAAMDLVAHGRSDLAYRFLNRWFDETGDHEGLPLLRYSMVYRALVRALVTALREGLGAQARNYVDTACHIASASQPRLLVTHGLPGSGKTYMSQRLLEAASAIRLRSDVERKRLFGLRALDDSSRLGIDIYGHAATERVYEHLLSRAHLALEAGYSTIIDAAFLRRDERTQAAALARKMGVPFAILDCQAPAAELVERVQARERRRDDASEAGVTVLERLMAAQEPLTDDERSCAITMDGASQDIAALVKAWCLPPP
jgi:aminoglycoside phosphotransferase family enzyme/predicted kinase